MWTRAKARDYILDSSRPTRSTISQAKTLVSNMLVVSPPWTSACYDPPMRFRGIVPVLALPLVIGVCFLLSYALPYVAADPTQLGIYASRQKWLNYHIVAGTLALLAGPVQLWLGLNRRTSLPHRIIGVVYVAAVLQGSVAAFYLARHTDFGFVFGMGFGSMAAAWLISTTLATIAVVMRKVEQHREWMIRSYVVTFGFVSFRTLDTLLDSARVGTLVERMAVASWMAWTIPLLITECILQARKIFARPAIAVKIQEASAYTGEPDPKVYDLQSSESTYQHQR
jgi:uncharacterized membrane protein